MASYIDLNDLGSFANIEALWAAHPEGGHEGDYCTIGGVKYRWDKYDRMWVADPNFGPTPARSLTTFDGDVNMQNNLTVAGTIRAKGVKQPCMGLFASAEALSAKWPKPEVGMWALVGNSVSSTSPAAVYRCDTEGTWSATGGTATLDSLEFDIANGIAGWVPISGISQLPANPTPEQQSKGYLLGTMLYVYVGVGGDTANGKYQSAQLKGIKGDQGNSGYSGAAGELEVVNNLTDGGATAALSAEMGKRLGERIQDNNVAKSAYDIAIEDEEGCVLSEFSNGHIKTKKFDSSKATQTQNSSSSYDAVIADKSGYVLAEFSDGHIKTKNFDSSNIGFVNEAIQKAVFMGDSITHGVYSYWNGSQHQDSDRYNGFDISNMSSVSEATAYHGIHYYFGRLAHCSNVVNLGKRGTGYVADTRNLGTALQVANSYDFSDVDFVALCFGVNDYIQGKTIGDISTQAIGTIIGNMCATIEKILTDNPLCKVVAYSPYNTWGQVSYGGDYTAYHLYGDAASNYALGFSISGNTLQDIINAEEVVCNYYGIQLVNLSQSNVINRFTIKNILIDGLHPSKASYIKLAAEIYGKGNFGD